MKKLLQPVNAAFEESDKLPVAYRFFCPACNRNHIFQVKENAIPGMPWKWEFDGNMEQPTFSPSLVVPSSGCHLFVRNGKIEYLSDCRHAYAGQVIDMVEV